MRTWPLCMRRVTSPVSMGSKKLHFSNRRPLFAYWWRKFIVRDLVTLTFDLLTLNSCHPWQLMWPTLPLSLKTLNLFVLELRVITFPISYRWKCKCGHCTCAESREHWVGGQNNYIFGIRDHDLPIHYTTFVGLRQWLWIVLLSSNVKAVFRRKFLSRWNWAQKWRFWGKWGSNIGFATPERHFG